jgi:hypothetical protein
MKEKAFDDAAAKGDFEIFKQEGFEIDESMIDCLKAKAACNPGEKLDEKKLKKLKILYNWYAGWKAGRIKFTPADIEKQGVLTK